MAGNSNQNRRQDDVEAPEIDESRDSGEGSGSNSRFSTTTLTRFAAVALFVVLGSLAVLHSMRSEPKGDEQANENTEQQSNDGLTSNDTPAPGADNAPDLSNAVQPMAQATSGVDESTASPTANPAEDPYSQFGSVADLGLSAMSKLVTGPNSMNTPPPALDVAAVPPTDNRKTVPSIPSGKIQSKLSGIEPSPPDPTNSFPNEFTSPQIKQPAIKAFDTAADAMENPATQNNGFSAPAGKLTAKSSPKDLAPPEIPSDLLDAPAAKSDRREAAFGDNDLRAKSERPQTPPPNRFAALPNSPIVGQGDATLTPAKPVVEPGNGFGPPTTTAPQDGLLSNARDRTRNAIENLKQSPLGQRAREIGEQGSEAIQQAGQKIGDLARQGKNRFEEMTRAGNAPGSPSTLGLVPPPARDFAPRVDPNLNRSSINPTGQQVVSNSTAPGNNGFGAPRGGAGGFAPPVQTIAPTNRQPNIRQPIAGAAPIRNNLDRGKDAESANSSRQDLTNRQPNEFNNSGRRQVPAIPASVGQRGFPPSTSTSAATATTGSVSAGTTLNVPGDRRFEGLQTPALAIEKRSPREVQVNQISNFEIVIKNVGRAPVDNVQVFDRVPSGAAFEGSTPHRQQQSGQLRWGLGKDGSRFGKTYWAATQTNTPWRTRQCRAVTFVSRSSMRTRVTQPVLEITHRTRPKSSGRG